MTRRSLSRPDGDPAPAIGPLAIEPLAIETLAIETGNPQLVPGSEARKNRDRSLA